MNQREPMRNRREFLRSLPLAGGALALPAMAGAATPPNVIVILTDDQGYGDLSCHGNPILKTPNLDRLHSESVRFTDFHVAAMCTPTRSQLMTGVNCLENGAYRVASACSVIRPEIPTMADVFAAGGYRTAHFGKWHLGDNYPHRPQDRGFQESVYFLGATLCSTPNYWKDDYFDGYYRHNGRVEQYKGYCTDVWFSEAMRWMRERHGRREPFFVYLPTNAPHQPVYVPDRYREPYRRLGLNVASYFGMIANIDENMGRLEAMLRETGMRDNTILIFMTDNGGTRGLQINNAGMRGGKQSIYDGGHRVPCFVRWPAGGLRPAGDIPTVAQCQDWLPTLIDLCGLPRPRGARFDGASLAHLLRGREQPELAQRMLTVQYGPLPVATLPAPTKWDAAVLWNQWRLVKGVELYDIHADPGQQQDIAAGHPDIVRAMREHYERWWSRVEPGLAEVPPIATLGTGHENPTMLTSHDWVGPLASDIWDLRKGIARNGPWVVRVDRAGQYEIALRRWPEEANLPLTSGAPAYAGTDPSWPWVFPEGKALPIARARIKAGTADLSTKVGQDDKAAVFRVRLAAGKTEIQTWFYDASGAELCGAYWTYIRRL